MGLSDEDLDGKTSWLIWNSYANRLSKKHLADFDLSLLEYFLLHEVLAFNDSDNCKVFNKSKLAKKYFTTKMSVSNAVALLEQKHYVEGRTDTDDARFSIYCLTESGLDALYDLDERTSTEVANILKLTNRTEQEKALKSMIAMTGDAGFLSSRSKNRTLLGFMFYYCAFISMSLLNELLERHDSCLDELIVLSVLMHDAPLPASKIGRKALFSPPMVSRSCEALLDKGMIEKTFNEPGKRIASYQPTASGGQFYRMVSLEVDEYRLQVIWPSDEEAWDYMFGGATAVVDMIKNFRVY